jgi:hypothetical protein
MATAPKVIPNMATEMAMKAKWYHIVTLKIRVKRISNISAAMVTRNRPKMVKRFVALVSDMELSFITAPRSRSIRAAEST